MGENKFIQPFGYSEMYEWVNIPNSEQRFGRFVQFDEHDPSKIKLCSDLERIVGVTTINSVIESDNPDDWQAKKLFNEYGDLYLQKENFATAHIEYDSNLEMSYMKTECNERLVPIINEEYDSSKKFIKRANRSEWVRVNILGKCIVEDDGKCKAGDLCTPVTTNIISKMGTVKKAGKNDKIVFHVLGRVSPKTILIFNK